MHRQFLSLLRRKHTTMFKLVVLASLVAVSLSDPITTGEGFWFCDKLLDEYCTNHNYEPKCGNDGVTYRNFCDMGKAHCADDSIDQKHPGPCNYTIPSPEEIAQGAVIILDVQCGILSHRECTTQPGEKLCASNGITYDSFCEYEKQRCTHKHLHVTKFADCAA